MANFPIKMLNFDYQYTFCNIADSRYQYFWPNIADILIADTIIGATLVSSHAHNYWVAESLHHCIRA